MNDLVFMPAFVLAALIRERKISATEAVDSYLGQVHQHNPGLNAVVTLDEENAKMRALEADAALARGEIWGPLHGVPFTLKDLNDTAGVLTTLGSPKYKNRIPEKDNGIAQRLKSAGGILMGKTNCQLFPDNPFGITRNPWNVDCDASGSSSGAAAALAAGMSALDIGSDFGGSIIGPAAVCGIYGMRPTEKRVLNPYFFGDPVQIWYILLVMGPMARSVEDLRLALKILSGPHSDDSGVPPVLSWQEHNVSSLTGLRIAWSLGYPDMPIEQDIAAGFEAFIKELDHCGAIVRPAFPNILWKNQLEIFENLCGGIFSTLGDHPISLLAYFTLLDQRKTIIQAWEQFFTEWDAIVLPSKPYTAKPIHADKIIINGIPLSEEQMKLEANCKLAILPGGPSLSIPLGRTRTGMPYGLLVLGKRWADEKILAIAERMAEITGGFQKPPGY